MSGREPLKLTLRASSIAALTALIPHYLVFYASGAPLWTEHIAEWIMARTPSRWAVPILSTLGNWAKPSAITGGLAALGFGLFVARLAGTFAPPKKRTAITMACGLAAASVMTVAFGYASLWGNASFWLPAILVIGLWKPAEEAQGQIAMERRTLLATAAQYGLPLVMGGGVVAVAAESYLRDGALARRAVEPVPLFPFQPPLSDRSFGGGLVRRALTPIDQFYGMSKNTVDPVVNIREWRLIVSLDGKPIRSFTFASLMAMPRQRRYVTLRCISNTLKSDLMGTAEWAGISLGQLVDRRMLPPQMMEAAFIGVEGHDDSMSLDYAFSQECLLAYGMNGKTLSRTHGYPLRLLAPRYYGCRNVKWIREIRFVSRPYYGTWQRLGYTKEPVIHTASHFDRMIRRGPQVEFGGASFAGSRGIRAVRVRANEGAWVPAQLESPLSPYCLTRWVGELTAPEGARLEANAQDGAGVWQELAQGDPFPTGLAGPTIVQVRV